ncbi:MAG: PGPGW domain-containing protein [Nanoarchaeota archaeon]
MKKKENIKNKPKNKSLIKKIILTALGLIILFLGILMIFLPGPAIVFIPAGLAILSTQSKRVKDFILCIKKKFIKTI